MEVKQLKEKLSSCGVKNFSDPTKEDINKVFGAYIIYKKINLEEFAEYIKLAGITTKEIIEYFKVASNNNKDINVSYINCISNITKELGNNEMNDMKFQVIQDLNKINLQNISDNIARKNTFDFAQPIVITAIIAATGLYGYIYKNRSILSKVF